MSDNNSNTNDNTDEGYKSRNDRQFESVVHFLEIKQQMMDAKRLLNESFDLILKKDCSTRDKKEHADLIRSKINPIFDLTCDKISENAKILAPIGGLHAVHNAEESERKRKAKIDHIVEEPRRKN